MGWLFYGADHDMPDMFGKVAIVTGGNSGIGFEVCKQLCKKQCTVYMAVRDVKDAKRAVELILRDVPWAKVTPVHCDLASQASIRTFATEFSAMGHPLHLLINNAGIYMPGPYRETQDGFEQTLGVNYFGHCYLTLLLQDVLMSSAPSRVINTSSIEEHFWDMLGDPDWSDLAGTHLQESGTPAYARSKWYTIAWSWELDRRLRGNGVDVFAVHPGITRTPIQSKASGRFIKSWATWALALVHGQSAKKGAVSALYAATDPWLQGRGGRYIGPSPTGMQLFGLAGSNTSSRWALNWHLWLPHQRARVFDETFKLLRPALPPGYNTHIYMLKPFLPSSATPAALLANEVINASHGGMAATTAMGIPTAGGAAAGQGLSAAEAAVVADAVVHAMADAAEEVAAEMAVAAGGLGLMDAGLGNPAAGTTRMGGKSGVLGVPSNMATVAEPPMGVEV